jgi:hypothetical protein
MTQSFDQDSTKESTVERSSKVDLISATESVPTTPQQNTPVEHQCHLGHCGVLISIQVFETVVLQSPRGQSTYHPVPEPSLRGFKRPPKIQA